MAQRFYRQGAVDLDSARESIRPHRYHNAVFFAEQAAEKGLKAAYWHLVAEEPTWTHQLDSLTAALADAAGGVPEDLLADLSRLTSSLERSRYPSGNLDEPIPADLIDEKDARSAVGGAERVMAWVESLLRQPTGRPKPNKS